MVNVYIDPRPALEGLLSAYFTSAFGGTSGAVAKIADKFATDCPDCAEGIRRFLSKDGNVPAAAVYMMRCHNWASAGTLAGAPKPGQIGPAAIGLRALQDMTDKALGF